MNSRVGKTFALLLLSAALSACTSFHKKPVAAAIPPPDAPELSQTPLYSPEMSENTPRVPNLPTTSDAAIVKPPPPPEKPRRIKKTKPLKAPDTVPATGAPTPASSATSVPDSSPTAPPIMEKKPTTLQASIPTPEASAASPIGDLTAGSSADTAQTTHEAEELIRTTREGLQGIKRPLSTEEKKTVAEIWNFLNRAEQAMKNGDVDGAHGLATKAKLLLDELTQK